MAAAERVEEVRWLDSGTHLHDGWQNLEVVRRQAPATLSVVSTVGHLIHEDDDVVVIGLSVAGDAVFGAQVIAKSAIHERRPLR